MSIQERQSLVNIFSGWIITAIYGWIVYQRHLAGRFDLTTDFEKWGVIFLIFIGISIAARIIILIIFHIINAAATGGETIPEEDERDKLIKLKSTRNSYVLYMVSFLGMFIGLALGMPVFWIFIIFIIGGLVSELADNLSQIYYYRKGVCYAQKKHQQHDPASSLRCR